MSISLVSGRGEEAATTAAHSTAEFEDWWKKNQQLMTCAVSCNAASGSNAPSPTDDGPTTVSVRMPVSTQAQPAAWASTLGEWKELASGVLSGAAAAAEGQHQAVTSPQLLPYGGQVRMVAAEIASVSPGRAATLDMGDGGANEVLISAEFVLPTNSSTELRASAGPQVRDALIGIVCKHYAGHYGSPQASIQVGGGGASPRGSRPPPSPNRTAPQQQLQKSPVGAVSSVSSSSVSGQGGAFSQRGSRSAGAAVAAPGVHERQTSIVSDIGSDGGSICEHHARTLSQPGGVDDMIMASSGGPIMMSSDAAALAAQQQMLYYQQQQQQQIALQNAAGYGGYPQGGGGGHVRVNSRNSNPSPNYHSRDHSRTFSNNSQNQMMMHQHQQQHVTTYLQQQQQQPYYGGSQQRQTPPTTQHQRMSSSPPPPPPTYNEAMHLISSGTCAAGPATAIPTVTVGKTAKQIQQENALNVRVTIGGVDPVVHARTVSGSSVPEQQPQTAGSSRSREGSAANDACASGEIVEHAGGLEQQQPQQQASTTPTQQQGHQREESNLSNNGSSSSSPPGHRKRLSNLALALTASPTENAAAVTPPLGPSQPGDGGTSPSQEMNSSLGLLPAAVQ